jgi:hypothetical protein
MVLKKKIEQNFYSTIPVHNALKKKLALAKLDNDFKSWDLFLQYLLDCHDAK